MVDKNARMRSRTTTAVLDAVSRNVDGIKRQIAKIGAVREETALGAQKVEQAASGLSQESRNLAALADDILKSVANIEALVKIARQGGSQADYAAARLGEMEEEWSDLLNDAIDQVIRISGGDLEYQVDDKLLRQALEGALERPLKMALTDLSRPRRQIVLETILEAMMTEPIDPTTGTTTEEPGVTNV